MKYEETSLLLIKALAEGKLEHRDPCACPVGHLIAKGLGLDVVKNMDRLEPTDKGFYWSDPNDDIPWRRQPKWCRVFMAGCMFCNIDDVEGVREEIQASGYNVLELMAIEQAFESVIPYDEMNYYNLPFHTRRFYAVKGIQAVGRTLRRIHNINQINPFKEHHNVINIHTNNTIPI